MMKMSMKIEVLENYLLRLIAIHIPDEYEPKYKIRSYISKALDKVEYCFSRIKRKYYVYNGSVLFDHLNSDHMTSFLYFLSNIIWVETGDNEFPTRLFYLNKVMHGLDLFYSVKMPDIFLFVHPVGTVLGNASYGDYLVVYQNCTVGTSDTTYPKFGTGTILYSKSSVIGDCNISDNVVFATNSSILNVNVPKNTLVIGQYPNQYFKDNTKTVEQRCFNDLMCS